jgi:hypothetical protein
MTESIDEIFRKMEIILFLNPVLQHPGDFRTKNQKRKSRRAFARQLKLTGILSVALQERGK